MTLDEAWNSGNLIKRADWSLWINKSRLGYYDVEMFKKNLHKSGVQEKELADDKWEVSGWNH